MPILGTVASQVPGRLAPTTGFVSIATTTVDSGGTGTITFSSIPSVYKHLQVRALVRSSKVDTTDMPWVKMNSDSTGSNYVSHSVSSNGATAYAGGVADGSDTYIRFSRMAGSQNASGIFSPFIVDILDYKDTNKYKTIRSLGGNDTNSSDGWFYMGSGLWQSTSAVTSLTFGCSNNFEQYSRIALYGIEG